MVEEVTRALLDRGCNLRDVATSVLSGHFALLMVCDGPDDLRSGRLEGDLRGRLEPGGLHVSAWDLDEVGSAPRPERVLTVYGPDRPGIVHGVAAAVAGLGVGICDMSCRFQDELYVLTMELQVPAGVEDSRLEATVGAACAELGLEHALHPLEQADL